MRKPLSTHISSTPTKAFPTLANKVEVYLTTKATRYGFKSYDKSWTVDGVNYYKTAREAKASVKKPSE
jgi:hypothetical protein